MLLRCAFSRIVQLVFALCLAAPACAAERVELAVTQGWRSALFEEGSKTAPDAAYQRPGFDDRAWAPVSVPHNWQAYAYARQVVKGSCHGTAWYRTALTVPRHDADTHVFLMFEGVNSYATVWLNGVLVGRHAGGLTSFTLDATYAAHDGRNVLAVRVDNPAGIKDLPWAAGDDEPVNGFAEGSQPFGIFRPVHLVLASALRIQPFGLYAWGGKGAIDAAHAALTTRAEVENLSARERSFAVVSQLLDPEGKAVAQTSRSVQLAPSAQTVIDQSLPEIRNPRLWSPETPALYRLRTRIIEAGRLVDEATTTTGLRSIDMTAAPDGSRRLLVNGKPVFLRGIAEYEHQLGQSHAFSPQEIDARIDQVEAAGFNAFRDAHYPHNLYYQQRIARDGLMWWPQFSAHIWFDNPAFRETFKARLADWVRERRNNPALFLWGLQNESILPEDFAREASDVIRAIDPTATVERLIVTCNGGKGADWNVPQNWSGTYGGNVAAYGDELGKQALVGEYGAWRALGWHSDGPLKEGEFTETSMTSILGRKARLAGQARDRAIGDFQWLLTTHENPGRPMRKDGTQIWDGIHPLDHLGPANNKGLMTQWGEPTDAYYLYRAMQLPAGRAPMVYIVSHTWPDRWDRPGIYSNIEVYSNCDAVELFNDVSGHLSLGRHTPDAPGSFRWDKADIRYDVLSAQCLMGGVVKARDQMHLFNLPPAPDEVALVKDIADITASQPGRHYLYRVNAGGSDYVDGAGRLWQGDRAYAPGRSWGWQSWAQDYPELDPRLGSRRSLSDLVEGTRDQPLFQSFRYGRDRLRYVFAAKPGHYRLELYFVEPWFGRAGIDAKGWRRFDVAVNGRTLLRDLDIFSEAGFGHALRKVVEADSVDGRLVLSFPHVAAGQAVLSAVAISQPGQGEPLVSETGSDLVDASASVSVATYLDQGDLVFVQGERRWAGLPVELLDSDWIKPASPQASGQVRFAPRVAADLYLALPRGAAAPEGWNATPMGARLLDKAGAAPALDVQFFQKHAAAGEPIDAPASAPVLAQRALPSPYAPGTFSLGRQKGLYEAESGTIENGQIATQLRGYGGQGYVLLHEGKAALETSIQTGLAGKIAFRLRYLLAGSEPVKGTVSIRDASGIVLTTWQVDFPPTGGSWSDLASSTSGFINAGAYTLRLETAGAAPIALDSLAIP